MEWTPPQRFLFCSGLATLTLLCTSPAAARRGARARFHAKAAGIQVFTPPGWVLQSRAALPGILATFKHPRGARIVLGARQLRANRSARDLALKNAKALKKLGWHVGKLSATSLGREPGLVFKADHPKGKLSVLQVYARRGKFGYILTFTSPPARSKRLIRDFQFVLRTARFTK